VVTGQTALSQLQPMVLDITSSQSSPVHAYYSKKLPLRVKWVSFFEWIGLSYFFVWASKQCIVYVSHRKMRKYLRKTKLWWTDDGIQETVRAVKERIFNSPTDWGGTLVLPSEGTPKC
jgi:hypothetical protein